MEFQYVVNIDSDEPIMLINKHIGFDDEDGMGVDGSLFQQELLQLDTMGKKRIQVWINSVGGLVMDGYNIANAILKSKTPVDTHCMGMAASIAGVIFQCGRKRYMADYGILMYHNPYSGDKSSSPLLDTMKESLNKIISSKSGMDASAVQRMMDRTSYIGASEAKQMGLCDEVENTVKLNTKYYPKASGDNKVFWKEANKVLNKHFNHKNNTVMLKVTNKLKLQDEASEDAILAAIEAVENRATEAEKELATVQNKSAEDLAAMKKELDEQKAKFIELETNYNKATEELKAQEEAKNKAEMEAKTQKATNMITEAVKIGKIKNDATVIAEWVSDAVENFDKTKSRIDGMAINKAAVKFPIVNKVEESKEEGKNLVALEMAKLQNKFAGK